MKLNGRLLHGLHRAANEGTLGQTIPVFEAAHELIPTTNTYATFDEGDMSCIFFDVRYRAIRAGACQLSRTSISRDTLRSLGSTMGGQRPILEGMVVTILTPFSKNVKMQKFDTQFSDQL